MDQRTPEWDNARRGKLTASNLHKIYTAKGPDSKGWKSHLEELQDERFVKKTNSGFTTPSMQAGVDKEGDARFCYELKTGNTVTEVGFIDHPTVRGFGASPDGLVDDVHLLANDRGGLEIKCPESKKHLSTLKTKAIDGGYNLQMYAGMLCTVRPWWDFVSYFPDLDEADLWIHRVHFDPVQGEKILSAVREFLEELDDDCRRLCREYPVLAERYAEWERQAFPVVEKKKRSLL